ncbi:hypothetical protein [Phytohabitans houttuyneae]|uniref:hypothetical protein n=1 Tax=Phytohabitans houttuyneae TaxID=1076126 RepID=UPI001FE2739A|nr:hypothetical protein [Phytohabitans houttuyneae]
MRPVVQLVVGGSGSVHSSSSRLSSRVRGRPYVSTILVTTTPTIRTPPAMARLEMSQSIASSYRRKRVMSTAARIVPNTPPRRPKALAPPSRAAPIAKAVQSRPGEGTTGASWPATRRTPPTAASELETTSAPPVSTAARPPRRCAGSLIGRNRPIARRTGLIMPMRPPRTETAATPPKRYSAWPLGS